MNDYEVEATEANSANAEPVTQIQEDFPFVEASTEASDETVQEVVRETETPVEVKETKKRGRRLKYEGIPDGFKVCGRCVKNAVEQGSTEADAVVAATKTMDQFYVLKANPTKKLPERLTPHCKACGIEAANKWTSSNVEHRKEYAAKRKEKLRQERIAANGGVEPPVAKRGPKPKVKGDSELATVEVPPAPEVETSEVPETTLVANNSAFGFLSKFFKS